MQKTLTIVTINYNNKEGLIKTINSVIAQTFTDVEYIIVDGDSTDGSKEVLEEYKAHIDFSSSEKDNGVYHAMNKGIAKATGEYILFLNSGDYLIAPETLQQVFSNNFSQDILYGDLETEQRKLIYPDSLDFFYFFKQSLGHPASFIKKKLFDKYGYYNEKNKIVSDWQFFLETIIMHKVTYKHINQAISFFDTTGMSTNPDNFSKLNKEMTAVLHPYLDEYYGEIVIGFQELKNQITNQQLKIETLCKKTIKYKYYKLIGRKFKF